MSDESVRFHNGDTLDSIPVVRPTVPLPPGLRRLPPDPTVFPPQAPGRNLAALGWVVAGALVVGALVGLSIASADNGAKVEASTSSEQPTAPAAEEAPSTPSPTPSLSIWQAPEQVPESVPEWEDIEVCSTPATGGDPSTDYCFSYAYDPESTTMQAALLANASDYACDDYLFSTHPSDFEGVWEERPPDCSSTPGGRTARVYFGPMTDWSDVVLYTCLLSN